MNPSFITKKLKQIKIKLSLQIFRKKDEIENIICKKVNEYAITCLSINSIMSDSELLKIENEKEQKIVLLFQEWSGWVDVIKRHQMSYHVI